MLTIERIIEARIAVPKLSIINPGTILLISMRRKALIKNVKSPRVKIFIGNVSKTIIGLTRRVKIPQTIDTTSKVCQPEITNPETYTRLHKMLLHL